MRLRKIAGIEEKIKAEYPHLLVADATALKGKWRQYFGGDVPLILEIGMGRGRFLNEMSLAFPNQNYVAVEMRHEVIYDAAQRFGKERKNIAVIGDRAEALTDWFDDGEVERIYLNFSDPWPKRAHRKRRLTHENYLALYRRILVDGGELFLRTDAASLMEFSLMELTNHGFALTEVSFDFHQSPYFDGIITEYEEKKSKTGPIYYARFVLRK